MKARPYRRAGIAILVGGVVLYAAISIQKKPGGTSIAPEDAQTTSQNLPAASQHAYAPAAASGPESPSTSPQLGSQIEPRNIWAPVRDDNVEAPPKVRDDIPGTLMSIDRRALSALAEGDAAELRIDDSRSTVFVVESIRNNAAYGVTSLRGTGTFSGRSLPAVITFAEDSILATFSAPDGVYELRGSGSTAWLYRARDLGIPGGAIPDFIVPERAIPTEAPSVSSTNSPQTE